MLLAHLLVFVLLNSLLIAVGFCLLVLIGYRLNLLPSSLMEDVEEVLTEIRGWIADRRLRR